MRLLPFVATVARPFSDPTGKLGADWPQLPLLIPAQTACAGLLGRKGREWAVTSVLCCAVTRVTINCLQWLHRLLCQPGVCTGSVLDEQELRSSSLPSLLLGAMWAGNFRAGSVCDTNSPAWSCLPGWPQEVTVLGQSWHSPEPGMAEGFESLGHALPSLCLQRGQMRGFVRIALALSNSSTASLSPDSGLPWTCGLLLRDHPVPSHFASLCRTLCFHPHGLVQAPSPVCDCPQFGTATGTGDTPNSAAVQGEAPPGMFQSPWLCLHSSCSLVTLGLCLSCCWEQRDPPGSPRIPPARTRRALGSGSAPPGRPAGPWESSWAEFGVFN